MTHYVIKLRGDEYQIWYGHRIISRHSTYEAAKAAQGVLRIAQGIAPARGL